VFTHGLREIDMVACEIKLHKNSCSADEDPKELALNVY
jgi:hypothetical protein